MKLLIFPPLDFRISSCIPASDADADVANPNGTKTLLSNVLGTFFIKGKRVFINCPRSLPKNPPDCTTLNSRVFHNFILPDELFAKTLQDLETYLSFNDNLCGKIVSFDSSVMENLIVFPV